MIGGCRSSDGGDMEAVRRIGDDRLEMGKGSRDEPPVVPPTVGRPPPLSMLRPPLSVCYLLLQGNLVCKSSSLRLVDSHDVVLYGFMQKYT
jgi:hypothetical protein